MSNQNVWKNVTLPRWKSYAQAAVSDEEMEKMRQLPLSDVRSISDKQIQRAKDYFKDVAGWAHWYDANLPEYVHWKPFKDVIDNAETNFDLGEKEGDLVRRKEYYIIAWRTSRTAIDKLFDEKKKNPSDFLVLIEPITKPVVDAYKEAKATIDVAKQKAEESAGVLLKAGIGLAILYVIISASRK